MAVILRAAPLGGARVCSGGLGSFQRCMLIKTFYLFVVIPNSFESSVSQQLSGCHYVHINDIKIELLCFYFSIKVYSRTVSFLTLATFITLL